MNQKGKLYDENVPEISKINSLEILSCSLHLAEIFMITRPRLQYGQRSVHCGYLTHIHLKERPESWDLEGGAQQSSACWLDLCDLKKVKGKMNQTFWKTMSHYAWFIMRFCVANLVINPKLDNNKRCLCFCSLRFPQYPSNRSYHMKKTIQCSMMTSWHPELWSMLYMYVQSHWHFLLTIMLSILV